MIEYSNELKENFEKISAYYLEVDNFEFLQKIMTFMYEGISYIEEHYFVVLNDEIKYLVDEGMKIWGKDGNKIELKKLYDLYFEKINKIKPVKIQNKEERTATYCIIWFLDNIKNDNSNAIYYTYDFIELFIEWLEILNIEENKVKKLMKIGIK
jgi:hypothetical protein